MKDLSQWLAEAEQKLSQSKMLVGGKNVNLARNYQKVSTVIHVFHKDLEVAKIL